MSPLGVVKGAICSQPSRLGSVTQRWQLGVAGDVGLGHHYINRQGGSWLPGT